MLAYIKYHIFLNDKRITDSRLILFSKKYIAQNKEKITNDILYKISSNSFGPNVPNKKQNKNISEVEIYVENKYILYKNAKMLENKNIIIKNLDPKIYSKNHIKISIKQSDFYTGNILITFNLSGGRQRFLFPYIIFIPIQKIINNHEDIFCSLEKYLKL